MAKTDSGKTKATKEKSKLRTLTAAERHKRFVETARIVEADETPEAFDKAFNKVVRRKPD